MTTLLSWNTIKKKEEERELIALINNITNTIYPKL